jgi:hypothetical protein
MSALPKPAEAANDGRAVIQLRPSRFVTIQLFEVLTGYTVNAVNTKISRGQWLENRQFVRRDGRVLMDMEGYEKWAATGVA